ncbi:MAG: glycosyltransferase [Pseudomonadota bacterium]
MSRRPAEFGDRTVSQAFCITPIMLPLASKLGSHARMIHYMTPQGVGDAWVGNELRGVKNAGVQFSLHALNAPASTYFSSDDIQQMKDETRVIYPVSLFRVLVGLVVGPFLFGTRYFQVLGNALFGARESLKHRLVALWQCCIAIVWARDLRHETVDLIHCQWIHSAGTVGMYGAWLLDVPFGFTGHAADLFRNRIALLDKIQRAEYIVCISYFHRDFFLIHGASPKQLKIMYCGIDPNQFTVRTPRPRGEKLIIASSGRLVEKKGFDELIRGCAELRSHIQFECRIAGSGPLEDELNALIRELNLTDCVTVTGEPLLQEKIAEFMHGADCYCLPCVWASDNDVDGLPQMLMEAMACGLPVVSTRLVGIPDLVKDGETGLLIEPNDPAAIAAALIRLHEDQSMADRLAENGRSWVVEKFNLETCLEPLITEYQKRISS